MVVESSILPGELPVFSPELFSAWHLIPFAPLVTDWLLGVPGVSGTVQGSGRTRERGRRSPFRGGSRWLEGT